MPGGPSLIFDKSSLESLNLDEAVLLDNFYSSVITPLFFVECLADLERPTGAPTGRPSCCPRSDPFGSGAVLLSSVVEGLVDNNIPPKGRDVGECIYCGERDGALGTEHAVPYGLNGPWTLLRASCDACAKITHRFEHDVTRCLWPDVRNVLAMQSRRRDKRSPTLPLILQRDGVQEVVQVPRTQYPTYLLTPLFPPPAILWSSRPVRGVFANLDTIHLCGPTFHQAS